MWSNHCFDVFVDCSGHSDFRLANGEDRSNGDMVYELITTDFIESHLVIVFLMNSTVVSIYLHLIGQWELER